MAVEIFKLQKLLTVFLTPLGLGLVLILAGLLRRRRWLAFLGLAWLWIWSLPVTTMALARPLESQNPLVASADLPKADVILVLGGAISPGAPGWHPEPNLHKAADRIVLAAQLYQLGKAPKLLYSGGPTNARGDSEATAGAEILRRLGVPEQALVLETNSRTTRENASLSLPMLQSLKAQRVLLVTSQWHMARALRNFRDGAAKAGLSMQFIAAPCDPIELADYRNRVLRWLPSTEALDISRDLFKELLGLAHAKLFGDRGA